MSPSSFRYLILRLPSSPSPSLSLLHLHLKSNSKRDSAPNSSVRLAYWHAHRLIICLCMAEKEIRRQKDNGKIKNQTPNLDRQCPILNTTCNNCHLAELPLFHWTLPLTFLLCWSDHDIWKIKRFYLSGNAEYGDYHGGVAPQAACDVRKRFYPHDIWNSNVLPLW